MRQTTRKTLTAAVVAGRYRLDREMARGGMGTVWLATDQKLGRQVAVKVMAQELAQMGEALQRFEREAQALAQLRSTHVVQVYDYGLQEGLPYIVMELLEGENLGQRLKRTGRLNAPETGALFAQICKGLKAAHNANLIHRDLKPSNIFIARRDDVEVVKLLDFGVVKALDNSGSGEATVTGLLLGTPQYMSPEQARATRDIDHRSDLWSAAVIAFRMLTSHNPFKGESVGDVVLKICSDALPKITDYRHDLPPALDEFFEKAFQRLPIDRYQSATEMAVEFARLLYSAAVPSAAVPSAAMSPAAMPFAAVSPAAMSSSPVPFAAPSSTSGMGIGRGSHEELLSGASSDDIAVAAMMQTALVPGSMAPMATSLGPPSMIPNVVMADATPHSTTVAGTQLLPGPAVRRPLGGQPLALVVGAAASLIVIALVAAIWVGSDPPAETSSAADAPRTARADMDLTSNDDDGGPAPEPSEDSDRSEDDVTDDISIDAIDPPSTSEPEPAVPKTGTMPKPGTVPPPKPTTKSGNDSRPDWGLSPK